jgi:hypothetical protein
VSLNLPIIDISTKRLERDAPLDLFFRTSNFCSTQSTATDNLNAFGVRTHRFLHSLLHGTAERDTLLKLLGDAAPNQAGIQFRLADLYDVHAHPALPGLGF